MYITVETIIKIAGLITALGVIVGVIVGAIKFVAANRRQSEEIRAIQNEQTVICYALRGALQGLIEQGCNGPCKDALARLDKHLNQSAHGQNKED